MQFDEPLTEARLIKRYKRFLADAELENGEIVTAHCANPGAMLGVSAAGSRIWLSKSNNPKRKLKYSWELIEVETEKAPTLVGINTAHPNKLVEEAILNATITELQGYDTLRREVKYGKNSRVDILLSSEGKPDCYVEVKNVHLVREPGLAEFPDSVTARGAKHLAELADVVKEGKRAALVYLIQRDDVEHIKVARDIDPNYAMQMDKACDIGIEILAYSCKLTHQSIKAVNSIPYYG